MDKLREVKRIEKNRIEKEYQKRKRERYRDGKRNTKKTNRNV